MMNYHDDEISTILIVDDEPNNLKVLNNLLVDNQFTVRAARNGESAIQTAKLSPPDLILLDIKMPNMDGYTAIRLLKQEHRCSVPIVALTAHAMRGDRDKALDAGCDEYETKPVNLARLLGKIESLTRSPLSP